MIKHDNSRKESQVDSTEPPKKKAENVAIVAEESCSSGEDGKMKPLDDRSEMWGTPKVGGLSSFSPSKMQVAGVLRRLARKGVPCCHTQTELLDTAYWIVSLSPLLQP